MKLQWCLAVTAVNLGITLYREEVEQARDRFVDSMAQQWSTVQPLVSEIRSYRVIHWKPTPVDLDAFDAVAATYNRVTPSSLEIMMVHLPNTDTSNTTSTNATEKIMIVEEAPPLRPVKIFHDGDLEEESSDWYESSMMAEIKSFATTAFAEDWWIIAQPVEKTLQVWNALSTMDMDAVNPSTLFGPLHGSTTFRYIVKPLTIWTARPSRNQYTATLSNNTTGDQEEQEIVPQVHAMPRLFPKNQTPIEMVNDWEGYTVVDDSDTNFSAISESQSCEYSLTDPLLPRVSQSNTSPPQLVATFDATLATSLYDTEHSRSRHSHSIAGQDWFSTPFKTIFLQHDWKDTESSIDAPVPKVSFENDSEVDPRWSMSTAPFMGVNNDQGKSASNFSLSENQLDEEESFKALFDDGFLPCDFLAVPLVLRAAEGTSGPAKLRWCQIEPIHDIPSKKKDKYLNTDVEGSFDDSLPCDFLAMPLVLRAAEGTSGPAKSPRCQMEPINDVPSKKKDEYTLTSADELVAVLERAANKPRPRMEEEYAVLPKGMKKKHEEVIRMEIEKLARIDRTSLIIALAMCNAVFTPIIACPIFAFLAARRYFFPRPARFSYTKDGRIIINGSFFPAGTPTVYLVARDGGRQWVKRPSPLDPLYPKRNPCRPTFEPAHRADKRAFRERVGRFRFPDSSYFYQCQINNKSRMKWDKKKSRDAQKVQKLLAQCQKMIDQNFAGKRRAFVIRIWDNETLLCAEQKDLTINIPIVQKMGWCQRIWNSRNETTNVLDIAQATKQFQEKQRWEPFPVNCGALIQESYFQ